MFKFQFPEITIDRDTPSQASKVLEEAAEAYAGSVRFIAYDEPENYVMELMDVIQACETALMEFNQEYLDIIKDRVIEKNRVRGYYDER